MEDIAVYIEDLWKSYNGVPVLAGVSMKVGRGESVGVVGPNGCGKSTLLKIIAGVETYDKGRVTVRGRPALVPQETILLPWRTLRGNILLAAKIRGVPRRTAEERIREAGEILGLAQYLDMYPREVSGGTARKAAILMMLVLMPDILLLDEPFTGLDQHSIRALQETVLKLKKAYGLTVITVSHMVDELGAISDRIYVMSHRPSRVVRVLRRGETLKY